MSSEEFLYTREKYKAVPEEEHVLKPPSCSNSPPFMMGREGEEAASKLAWTRVTACTLRPTVFWEVVESNHCPRKPARYLGCKSFPSSCLIKYDYSCFSDRSTLTGFRLHCASALNPCGPVGTLLPCHEWSVSATLRL